VSRPGTFQPGQSGNPKGRPKKPLSEDLRLYLQQRIAPHDVTRRQKLIEALYEAALKGEVPALKLIFERLDGAVPQPVVGADGGPIRLVWERDDAGAD